MFKATLNNIYVKVKTKYHRQFSEMFKRSALQNGATIDQTDYVNIIGEVVSVPTSISMKREYRGFSVRDVRVGDIAIFSYEVISEMVQKGEMDDPIYKNLVFYKGEEYFAVDVTRLFAVIRDGVILMQNGYVMLEQMSKPPLILMSQNTKKMNAAASGVVTNIGKNQFGVEQFDKVFYSPNKIQAYEINEKKFGIIRMRDVLGKEIPTYKEIPHFN